MTKSINIKDLVDVLKKSWWKILIFTVIVSLGAGLFAQFFVPRKYAASIEFMVNNANNDNPYTTQALTAASGDLAKDYIVVISGDTMVDMIKEYVANPLRDTSGRYANLSSGQIRSMISSNATASGSSIFSITVTATEDSHLAYYVAECIALNAPSVITKIVRGGIQGDDAQWRAVSVIRKPVYTNYPSSPNIKTYVLVSGLIAAAASYLLFVVVKMFDNVITNEEDLKEKLNKTVIGDIPEWTLDSSVRNKENG